MSDIERIEKILLAMNSGDKIPEMNPSEFGPDFQRIVREINTLSEGFGGIVECTEILSAMTFNDYTRKVTGDYSGAPKVLAETINTVQDRLITLQHVAEDMSEGDFKNLEKFRAIGDGAGRRSENDKIVPAFIKMMEAISNVSAEIEILGHNAADGNISYRSDPSLHSGEYKDIVEAVNTAIDAFVIPMKESINVCQKYADADFTARFSEKIIVKGDFVTFKNAVNNIGESVSANLSETGKVTEQVVSNSNEVAKGTDEVAKATEGVANASQKTADLTKSLLVSIDDITRQISDLSASNEEIASTSQEVYNAASHVVDVGKETQELANVTNRKMGDVEKIASKSVEEIQGLTVQVKEVGKIVKLINDIAGQINLLALNAAIEAARAGEHGRGFAVVAGEVKNLAAEARAATDSIEKVVSAVQSGSENTAKAIMLANNEIVDGVESVNKTLEALNVIIKNAGQVTHDIGEITKAIEDQAQIANNVVNSAEKGNVMTKDVQNEAESLAALAEESSASVEEIGSAVNEVNELIKRLEKANSRFKY
ncbi:methyl-accepting chemotaxis protein [Methanomicrobium antiquum]|uniref:Methyl-accepting chemotaxis protein n=1 Tax=Methanomicrobium antiquum TaxID=487686 RepID=A0AAF0FR28_9EURY|nr:methyl-accepting chemotaxis protein [Methanomicrobium antiquum]WFN36436.1 methyl-accepting chemotaxis protein [Methanomicrobium antiquum]